VSGGSDTRQPPERRIEPHSHRPAWWVTDEAMSTLRELAAAYENEPLDDLSLRLRNALDDVWEAFRV
jgi:hypothetical protein